MQSSTRNERLYCISNGVPVHVCAAIEYARVFEGAYRLTEVIAPQAHQRTNSKAWIAIVFFIKLVRKLCCWPSAAIILTAPSLEAFAAILIARAFGIKIKVAYTLHEPHLDGKSSRRNNLINCYSRLMCMASQIVIMYSDAAVRKYRRSYISHKKTAKLPLPSRFYEETVNNSGDAHARYEILLIGNLSYNKDIRAFVETAKLCSDLPYRFIIAGKGSIERERPMISQCANITVINRFISECDYIKHLLAARFTLLPYLESTQSAVVRDAFLYGAIPIATNVGSFSEDIPSHIGYIIPIDKFATMASRIIHSVSDSENAKMRLGILGYVKEKYTRKNFAIQVKNLVQARF